MIRNQLSLQEARNLFDYRDGILFWRHAGSGRRRDLRAVIYSADRVQINIGGKKFDAHYVVWNWHHGITAKAVRFRDENRRNIDIGNLVEVETFIDTQSAQVKMSCPCCSQAVPVPSAYIIAQNCGLTPMETRILEAVWDGKGRPVQTERIFDRMYEDDPDGGPPPARMYATFKEKLSLLKKKLIGSGVGIENVGRREGYRLVMGAMNDNDPRD